jgi:hypothetical protein
MRAFVAILFAFAAIAPMAGAQSPAMKTKELEIKRLQFETDQNPDYNPSRTKLKEGKAREWTRILFQFETDMEWTDEVLFTCHVLLQNPRARTVQEKYTLLKGAVTYVFVPRGRHVGYLYIHPSVTDRFGPVDGVALEGTLAGRLAAVESTSPAYKKWIEQLPARDGMVLRPSQTPFAVVETADTPMVKP